MEPHATPETALAAQPADATPHISWGQKRKLHKQVKEAFSRAGAADLDIAMDAYARGLPMDSAFGISRFTFMQMAVDKDLRDWLAPAWDRGHRFDGTRPYPIWSALQSEDVDLMGRILTLDPFTLFNTRQERQRDTNPPIHITLWATTLAVRRKHMGINQFLAQACLSHAGDKFDTLADQAICSAKRQAAIELQKNMSPLNAELHALWEATQRRFEQRRLQDHAQAGHAALAPPIHAVPPVAEPPPSHSAPPEAWAMDFMATVLGKLDALSRDVEQIKAALSTARPEPDDSPRDSRDLTPPASTPAARSGRAQSIAPSQIYGPK